MNDAVSIKQMSKHRFELVFTEQMSAGHWGGFQAFRVLELRSGKVIKCGFSSNDRSLKSPSPLVNVARVRGGKVLPLASRTFVVGTSDICCRRHL